MYVEEIVSKRKEKEYKTILVRESYREGSSVNHRTIANISNLPQGCIEEIKRYLKGNSGNLDFSQVQVVNSKEYGASQSALSFARKLGLDALILSSKSQWRENILALIVGKLLYPGNEVFLTSQFTHTVLWESCGHPPNIQPNVYKHYYDALNQLLSRKKTIQKKLQKMHLTKESIALLFLTSTDVEEEMEYDESLTLNYDDFQTKTHITALLTNFDGCPIAVEVFPAANMDDNEKHQRIQEFIKRSNLQNVILIGNQNKFNKTIHNEFRTITALTPVQINAILQSNTTPPHLSSNYQIHEIINSLDPSLRYIYFVDLERKQELGQQRYALIKMIEKLLEKIQKKNQNVLGETEKIWKSFGNKEFFHCRIDNGKLHFSVNVSHVREKELLDGCYMISTNVEREALTPEEIVNIYRKLSHIRPSFKVIKTMTMKFCPISLENRIHSHAILCMLSYYLQWHMNKRLETALKFRGETKVRRWTLPEALEKLKSIKTHTVHVGDVTLDMVKSSLDEEQRAILSALGITLVAKLSQ